MVLLYLLLYICIEHFPHHGFTAILKFCKTLSNHFSYMLKLVFNKYGAYLIDHKESHSIVFLAACCRHEQFHIIAVILESIV